MKGVKHSSYLWVADNNWINFAEKWMCFDALVADWQSAGFSPIYHSPFICCCQTFPQPPFQGRLIKQLFNKTKRHLHSQRTELGFSAQGGDSWNEYQLTLWHAVNPAMRSLTQYQEDSADFVCYFEICQASSDSRGHIHYMFRLLIAHQQEKTQLSWTSLFGWTSSRAALFATAKFTPLLHWLCCWCLLNTFAFLLHFQNTTQTN